MRDGTEPRSAVQEAASRPQKRKKPNPPSQVAPAAVASTSTAVATTPDARLRSVVENGASGGGEKKAKGKFPARRTSRRGLYRSVNGTFESPPIPLTAHGQGRDENDDVTKGAAADTTAQEEQNGDAPSASPEQLAFDDDDNDNDDDDGESEAGEDDEDDRDTQGDDPEEVELIGDGIIAMLESDQDSSSFKKISFADGSGRPICQGDVVELARSKLEGDKAYKSSAGYVGVVEEVRALNSDIDIGVNENGVPTKSVNKLYIKVGWFYSKYDFNAERDRWNAFQQQSANMGSNERVKSDHTDWDVQTNLVIRSGPELVYIFDDAYPAANASGQSSVHPLDFYSTPRLADLSPSPYATRAFSTLPASGPRNAPRKAIRAGTDLAIEHALPSFYFGVTSAGALPPTSRPRKSLIPHSTPPYPEELFANGANIKDGLQDTFYTRTAFSWDLQPALEGSGDVIKPSEINTWKRYKTGGKKDRAPKKLWPLTFNLHSDPPKPYDPLSIQHYSRAGRKWYDVSDLFDLQSYRLKPDEPTNASRGETAQAPASAPVALSNGPSSKRSNVDRALLDFDDDDDDDQEDDGDSGNVDRGPPHGTTSSIDRAVSRLVELAEAPIVRGGAYGLTGNAYLVARASWLQPPVASEWIDHTARVLDEWDDWRRRVDDRARGQGEGRGLKLAWRATDQTAWWPRVAKRETKPGGIAAGLDDGEDHAVEFEWVCPDTDEPI
ncbi:hypothetical protein JCM11491_004632 [Sporobolomyces phaffii]